QLLTNIAQAFNGFIDSAPKTKPVDTKSSLLFPTPSDSDLPHTTADPKLDLTPTLEQKIENYLSTQHKILEQNYHESEILLDEKDIGKLQDVIAAFNHISELETDTLPSKKVFPPHRIITNKNLCIAFLSSSKGGKFTSRIQNFNEAVATKEETRFILWRDVRSDEIKQKTVGSREINKLNNTKNGEFKTFERDHRITFELLYKLISDIYNQDLDINMETEFKSALKIAAEQLKEYWLIQELLSL
ncbi:MAG: exonuclease, partial [Cyanobacteria bacterium J06631_2]